MHLSSSLLAAAVLVGVMASTGLADEVQLHSGGTIRGRVLSEDDKEVVVQTDAGPVRIARDKVKEVIRSKAPPPSPTTEPTPAESAPDAAAARGTLLLFGFEGCDRALLEDVARGVRRSLAIKVEVLLARPKPDDSRLINERTQWILNAARWLGEPADGTPEEIERRIRTKLQRDPRPEARGHLQAFEEAIAPKLDVRLLGAQAAAVGRERGPTAGLIAAFGVTHRDLGLPGMNFVFGRMYREQRSGALSYHAFTFDNDRRALVRRTVAEAVFLTGWILGLEHCPTATCAAFWTTGLADHDRKSVEFCKVCRAKFDAALAKRR